MSENFISSCFGATMCVTISSPLDVIKTRIQRQSFDQHESGWTLARDLLRKEGIGAFFKGVLPKWVVVGPRLVFSYTVAQSIMQYIAASGT